MKLKGIVGGLVLLNLGTIFGSAEAEPLIAERVKSAPLSLADQVWDLSCRHARDEAFKLLARSHTAALTAQDHSRILDFLRIFSHAEVVEVLDGAANPGQAFLKGLLLEVFPDHADFWKFIRLSKQAESKAAASAGLFDLMTHADTPVVVKRHAAEVVAWLCDDDYKNYLGDAQLEQVRAVLEAALNDESAAYRDRDNASDELLVLCNADRTARLGTEAQRKAAVAIVFGLGQKVDVPCDLRVNFLYNTITAPSSRAPDYEYKKYKRGLMDEGIATDEQKRAALQMIIDLRQSHVDTFLWVRASDGTLLATPDQRAQALKLMHLRMREGRVAQKFAASGAMRMLRDEVVCETVTREQISAIQKEAVQILYALLDSTELLPTEKLRAFRDIAMSGDADDDMKRDVIRRTMVAVKDLPRSDPAAKLEICNVSRNVLLSARDKHGSQLATIDQRKELISSLMGLLSDASLRMDDKNSIACYVFNGEATDAQLQATIPFLLIGKFLAHPHAGRDSFMRSVLTRKTEDGSAYLATTPQRQKALEILAGFMNDTSKKVAERKADARAILDTVDTVPDSGALKAAASAVMALADE